MPPYFKIPKLKSASSQKLNKFLECSSTMRNFIFLMSFQLGKSLFKSIRFENRIVTKSLFSLRLTDYFALANSFKSIFQTFIYQSQYRSELGFPICFPFQILK